MTIDEAIQQKSFRSENHRALANVLYTASWLHARLSKALKPFALTHEQYNVLRILRGQHPNAVLLKEITTRMIDKNSNTSRIVEKLRQKALVDRREAPDDRRGVNITITKKGMNVLKQLDDTMDDDKDIGIKLPETQAKQLNSMLDRIRSEE